MRLTGQRIRGQDAQSADRDLPDLSRRSAVRQDYSNDYLLGDIVASREWDDFRLVSALGAVRHELRERFDATLLDTPRVFDQDSRFNLFSFETRLSRQRAGGAVNWLAGVSFLRNRSEQIRAIGSPEAPQPEPGVVNLVDGRRAVRPGHGPAGRHQRYRRRPAGLFARFRVGSRIAARVSGRARSRRGKAVHGRFLALLGLLRPTRLRPPPVSAL